MLFRRNKFDESFPSFVNGSSTRKWRTTAATIEDEKTKMKLLIWNIYEWKYNIFVLKQITSLTIKTGVKSIFLSREINRTWWIIGWITYKQKLNFPSGFHRLLLMISKGQVSSNRINHTKANPNIIGSKTSTIALTSSHKP